MNYVAIEKPEATSIRYLRTLAEELDKAERIGATEDSPEGVRWIQISDTLASEISTKIRLSADILEQAIDWSDR